MPAIDVTNEVFIISGVGEVLDDGVEEADAIIGNTGLVAIGDERADAVVNLNLDATSIGDSVEIASHAGIDGGDVDLDIHREGFDIAESGSVASEEEAGADGAADLFIIAEEDAGEIDEVSAGVGFGEDRESVEDAITVSDLDGVGFRGTGFGTEAGIAADDVKFVADLFEAPDDFVAEAPAHATDNHAAADAFGDGGNDKVVFIKMGGCNFNEELLFLVVD